MVQYNVTDTFRIRRSPILTLKIRVVGYLSLFIKLRPIYI